MLHLVLKWLHKLLNELLRFIGCKISHFRLIVPAFHTFYLVLIVEIEHLSRIEYLLDEVTAKVDVLAHLINNLF